jgi:hypothetical protein
VCGIPVSSSERAQLKVTPNDLRRNLRARPHAKLFLLRIYFVLDRLYWRIVFEGQNYRRGRACPPAPVAPGPTSRTERLG